ncbi:Testis-expressed sequence 30 protein [Cyphellophora attinorum]|uniref:Testis-expressed sequence 30 protein n=1 Tax=Cyphellophora attinorum TaxID=1664694 RepID=A0A0N1H8L7_9EURO|nr:Testis-expressed sequence 30 protein [Phialophora attinorum]KPI39547.1 Testis-expressed sequence 30 protein [Phialophora attinorum]
MPPKAQKKKKQQTVLTDLVGGSHKTGNQSSNANDAAEQSATTHTLSFDGKHIEYERYGSTKSEHKLVFTHGAGGGIANPATKLFAKGAATKALVYSFQGSMNLPSRTKSFSAMIDHHKDDEATTTVLGGRSMGARAAVLAAADHAEIKHLVLASYPLVGQNGSVRDDILLAIDEGVKVLFISGDSDNMCSIKQLNEVRKKMKAKSWLAIVQGADHGMSIKPKSAVEDMRLYTGKLAARWIEDNDNDKTECELRWNAHEKTVVNDGWKSVAAKGMSDSKSATKFVEADADDVQQRPAKRQRKR